MPAMLAALLWLLLRGAAAEDISCVGGSACRNRKHTCVDDGRDCTLTCSGYRACYRMTVHGPPRPHTLTVHCEGGGGYTCHSMKIHAEASAALHFTCGTTGSHCGNYADIFCPNCDQNAERTKRAQHRPRSTHRETTYPLTRYT